VRYGRLVMIPTERARKTKVARRRSGHMTRLPETSGGLNAKDERVWPGSAHTIRPFQTRPDQSGINPRSGASGLHIAEYVSGAA
jgi:hypothetical protein